MPVPKRKRSRARRDSRFANKGIKVKAITGCVQCNEPLIPHSACKKCGFYKGSKVLATKADRKVTRLMIKDKKDSAKKAAEAQKQQAE
jgi:large subunit ribosomal protein L32